ncbi:MAG: hypothetical protein WAJ82_10375, partial [Azonexus sp.]
SAMIPHDRACSTGRVIWTESPEFRIAAPRGYLLRGAVDRKFRAKIKPAPCRAGFSMKRLS